MTNKKRTRGARELKKDDIVLLTWLDQSSYTSPHSAEDAINRVLGYTIGWFLEQDAEWLAVGMERMEGTEHAYRHVITIPKCCIKKIEILRKVKS